MTNKHNPAQLDCIVNSDLSSKYLDINSEVDNILNNNFKVKTGRPSKLTFTQLLYCLNLKREYIPVKHG
jgi:hypothetical protein